MNVGKVFMQAREARGLCGRELARIIGVSPSALWKIENGKVWPKQATLEKFCKVCGYSIARLYVESIEPIDYVVHDTND